LPPYAFFFFLPLPFVDVLHDDATRGVVGMGKRLDGVGYRAASVALAVYGTAAVFGARRWTAAAATARCRRCP
jgi:hypothetical protein